MFDLGWQEFLIIAFVLVIVVGPKDLPKVLKTFTNFLRQVRQMASEFHRSIENMADETELKDVKKSLNQIKNTNFDSLAKEHLDPTGSVGSALNEAKKSADLANNINSIKETLKTSSEKTIDNIDTKEVNNNKNNPDLEKKIPIPKN